MTSTVYGEGMDGTRRTGGDEEDAERHAVYPHRFFFAAIYRNLPAPAVVVKVGFCPINYLLMSGVFVRASASISGGHWLPPKFELPSFFPSKIMSLSCHLNELGEGMAWTEMDHTIIICPSLHRH
jgi:hypothetical protein